MNNFILTYYQQIRSGAVVVSKWVRLLMDLIVKGIENKDFFYDPVSAGNAIDWIEQHCFHTEGDLAPAPFRLELWQKAIVSCIYGLKDSEGNRQFREVFLTMGRKNGKTLFAAALGRYEWKMSGFGARIYCTAPKLDQAELIYNSIWVMTTLDPEYEELKEKLSAKDVHGKRIEADDGTLERHRRTDMYIPAYNSTVKKLAFSEKRSDGFNPSLTVCDEVASWAGDAGLKQYEVLKSAMGARKNSYILSVTTSGYINDSIYDELIKRSTRFLLGDSKERRLLPFLYIIDDPDKWADINELRKSNPNLGVSVRVDYLLEEIAVAEGSLSKKAEFLTKYCCIKQNSSLAWLESRVVEDACGDPLRLEDFKDCYCVGGIDLSQTRDLTACCIVIEKGGEFYVFAHFYLPAEKIDEATQRDGLPYQHYIERGLLTPSGDNFVDYHDCEQWFKDLVEQYRILPLKIGYDRYSASYLVQDMQNYGFHMDSVYQGENLYPLIQETQGLLEDRKIHIGDNDILKAHLLNSAVKMSVERGRGKLVKLRPVLHIDGAAALLDAMTVRSKYYAEIADQLRN